LRVTPPCPPLDELEVLDGTVRRTRLMNPLLSFAVGLPLMFETK